jgi:hypothetical protein
MHKRPVASEEKKYSRHRLSSIRINMGVFILSLETVFNVNNTLENFSFITSRCPWFLSQMVKTAAVKPSSITNYKDFTE